MKFFSIILALLVSTCDPAFAVTKIQQQGIKTAADCIAAGASVSGCVPLSSQVWDSFNNMLLSQSISTGAIAGAGGAPNVVGSPGSPQQVTSGGITVSSQTSHGLNLVFVAGSGGIPVTITSSPALTPCAAAGQQLQIFGASDSGAVTLQGTSIASGSKLIMPGTPSLSLGSGATASFTCDGASGNYWLTANTSSFINATGGTITQNGNFKVHTFTSGGSFTVLSGTTMTAEVLVIAGGGGGAANQGGGGGAGGLIDNVNVTLAPGTYSVVVGAAGVGGNAADGANGNNSSFTGLTTCIGGGGGAQGATGIPGGSGGGVGYNYTVSGSNAGTSGQGFAGGSPGSHYVACDGSLFSGAGGGGATGAGQGGCGTAPVSLQGGPGYTSAITGSSICYAGGGNGGFGTGTQAAAQCGGGLGFGNGNGAGGNATVYGAGGGASSSANPSYPGGNGFQGVVIVTYRSQ